MNLFHFLRPEWFLALLPLALLLWHLRKKRRHAGNWQSVCDSALLPYLLDSEQHRQSNYPWGWLALCGLLAIFALAGPVWSKLEQPVFRQQSALVIALDLSRSMDAGDIKPSRLVRAHHKLLDILKQRREGETALLVYAAETFVVTPLTDDNVTIASQVTSLTTSIMPNQGSRPALAIAKALELLQQAGRSRGDLLLITDGIATGDADALADQLPQGFRLSVLAVATETGAPIPQSRGGFLKDASGQIVIPRLQRAELVSLARLAGGRFAELTTDDADINHLLGSIESNSREITASDSDMMTDRWREEGPWLLLLLLPLGALAFRRGYLGLLFVLLIPFPETSYALGWDNLWSRPDQRAAELFEQGSVEQAAEVFENPAWRAVAQYRAGNFKQSEVLLGSMDTAVDHYNRGNALARQGKYPEAVQAYQQALDGDAENSDARFNQQVIKDLLKQQEQEKNQKQDGSSDSDQQKQPSDKASEQPGESGQGESDASSSEPADASGKEQSDDEAGSAGNDTKTEDKNSDDPGAQGVQSEPKQASAEDKEQPLGEPSTKDTDSDSSEQEKATEQWLKRIPDDPSGLLRRKFRYQYQQLKERRRDSQPW